jgi:hypothetical protein
MDFGAVSAIVYVDRDRSDDAERFNDPSAPDLVDCQWLTNDGDPISSVEVCKAALPLPATRTCLVRGFRWPSMRYRRARC